MSNEVTISQMNEVIARFMGFEKVRVGYFGCDDETEWQLKHAIWMEKMGMESVGDYFVDVKDDLWFELDNVAYDREWSWLMPVGKKIRDLLNDMQKQRPPHTACHGDLIEVDIHCAVGEYDIVNAHKHMYTFITWYNEYQQKQTNEQ